MWIWTLVCCGFAALSPGSMAPWSSLSPRRRSLGGRCRSSTAQGVLREVHTSQAEERLRAGSAWQQTGYVFTTELGTPYEPRNALRALQAAARQVGLPDIGLHTLRHSAAAVMLVNGVPLKVVSEVLGHASIGITGDIYGHVSPDVSRDALARLSEALG